MGGPELSLLAGPAGAGQAADATCNSTTSRAPSPAGQRVFPCTIDIYHRGTNLTAPKGHRYALMTCFKAASNAAIAFTAWAFHHKKPWARIFDNASPEQLACFGVPRPGHAFWTPTDPAARPEPAIRTGT